MTHLTRRMAQDRPDRSRRRRGTWWRIVLGVVSVAPSSGTAVLVTAGVLPVMASAQQPGAAPLVFDQVTVIDVETGQHRPQQRVVVVGHRIHAVGEARQVPLPPDAQVIEAQGKYLIPGLWDLHVHPAYGEKIVEYRLYNLFFIANGITGIRNAHTSSSPLDTAMYWWREVLAGRQVGPPRQLISGPHITALSDEEIAERKAHGANFLKLYPFAAGDAAAIRRMGLLFGGHVHGSSQGGAEAALEASDSGISIIDHPNTSGGLEEVCLGTGASVARCRPIAERFRRNGTWFAPTLLVFGQENFPLPGKERGKEGRAVQSIRQRSDEFSAKFWASDTVLRRNLGPVSTRPGVRGYLETAQRAGLPLLAGTDVAPERPAMLPGFTLHAELEASVGEGLTPLAALQSATLNPAQMLRATDSLGTVAPGKLADLVLLDADPLKDITNTTAIHAVVANGRYFDRAALDQLLAEVRTIKGQPGQSGRGSP